MMADRKKVIKGLQIERECVSRDCDRDCGKCDLVQDRDWLLSVYDNAIAMLKEQDAVEPHSHLTDDDILYFTCGKCGNIIFSESYKYCPTCGLKVAWNGEAVK